MEVLLLSNTLCAHDLDTAVPVRQIRTSRDIYERHLAESPPAALIMDADVIDAPALRLLEALHARGMLSPLLVVLSDTRRETWARAWPLARLGARLASEPAELQAELNSALASETVVSGFILRRTRVECKTSSQLINLLAHDSQARNLDVDELARRLHVSRSTLYNRTAKAGLPSPERCQALYRLLPAVTLLQRGASADRAATQAALSDSRALRQALRSCFGMTIKQVRTHTHWDWLLDRWLKAHCRIARQPIGGHMRRSGFTLTELLVVIAVIGLLAGFVAPNVFKHLGTSRQAAARSQIELLGAALDAYRLDTGRYPTTEQGLESLWREPLIEPRPTNWSGPYLRKAVPNDPWGRAYIYRNPPAQSGAGFDLTSFGADGIEGGEGEDADIASWEG
jgi:general secretion pathway protein G